MRSWSTYQEAIFREVSSGHGHLAVRARAGTGKTTTIVEALSHIPTGKSALLVAFNKSIATELGARAPKGVEVSTLHALGFRAVRQAYGSKVKVDNFKMRGIFEKIARSADREDLASLCKIASLAKASLAASADEIEGVIDAFQIVPPDGESEVKKFVKCVQKGLLASKDDTKTVDFDDMIWLPVINDLATPKFDLVFVDETQDLNAAQVELALRACTAKGRIVAVGDDRQAIYGFRGVSSDAFGSLVERLSAKVLPLSVTYRCARVIVREAQEMVPDLEAAPHAGEGIVREIGISLLEEQVAPGDFILSRANAPLVPLCLSLLRKGVRANIQGRDIGTKLAATIRRQKADDIATMLDRLDAFTQREVERLDKKGCDVQGVIDTYETIESLSEDIGSVAELLARIERLFADDGHGNVVMLSSTHKAKGLERDRAFILRDTYCKTRRGQLPGEEEFNLLYVAVTRAKNELVYVRGLPGRES